MIFVFIIFHCCFSIVHRFSLLLLYFSSFFNFVSLFFIIFHCFFSLFSQFVIGVSLCFIIFHCCFPIFHHFSLFFLSASSFFIGVFPLFHHFSLFFSIFSSFFHCCFLSFSSFFIVFVFYFHYFSSFFIAFQLFNVILWALIRLKNTKTDKIEYFRDPGVTWLQIIYLEAFHCVEMLVCWFPRYVYINIYKYYIERYRHITVAGGSPLGMLA